MKFKFGKGHSRRWQVVNQILYRPPVAILEQRVVKWCMCARFYFAASASLKKESLARVMLNIKRITFAHGQHVQ